MSTGPRLEQIALEALLALAFAADVAMDDSEELEDGSHRVDQANVEQLCKALDRLEDLPDDQPGYTMGPAAKARWALRILLGEEDTTAPDAFRQELTRGLTMTEAGNLFADLADLNLTLFDATCDEVPAAAVEICGLGKKVREILARKAGAS